MLKTTVLFLKYHSDTTSIYAPFRGGYLTNPATDPTLKHLVDCGFLTLFEDPSPGFFAAKSLAERFTRDVALIAVPEEIAYHGVSYGGLNFEPATDLVPGMAVLPLTDETEYFFLLERVREAYPEGIDALLKTDEGYYNVYFSDQQYLKNIFRKVLGMDSYYSRAAGVSLLDVPSPLLTAARAAVQEGRFTDTDNYSGNPF